MDRLRQTILATLLLVWGTCATATTPDYWRSDSIKVVRLLREASRLDTATNYMIHFARQLRGLPYVGKTLEHNAEERLVVNLRQMDCTTYVETVVALALCMQQRTPTFEAYCRNLQQVRYRDGLVHYANRLHYFTYWMNENVRKGIVAHVEGPASLFAATQTVQANYMTTHVNLYPMLVKHPEWMPQIRQMEQAITGNKYRYIPKHKLDDTPLLRQTIHDGDIIVILTSRRGLDTSHIGIAVWHADGLHLLNASSLRHKVVEEPKLFKTYMAQQRSHTGIRVVRLR